MSLTSIGDMVQHFAIRRQNTQLKNRLNTLTNELSSGVVQDATRHLGARSARLTEVDRSLGLLSNFDTVLAETGQTLALMQTVFDHVDHIRGNAASTVSTITISSTNKDISTASKEAKIGLETMMQTLNTRFAGRSLFAGVATDRDAVVQSDELLATLKTIVSGAGTATEVEDAIVGWLSGGGYVNDVYLGDVGDLQTRKIDMDEDLQIDARADDPAVVSVLVGMAMAAMTDDLSLSRVEKADLLRRSGERLLGAAQEVAHLQGTIGLREEQIAQVTARHTAQVTLLTLQRNDLVSADPFQTASQLQEVQTQLETHYMLTARLSGLSLTEYLR